MTQTLPETLVATIRTLIEAHRNYCAAVEELHALGASMQGDLDRLVSRQDKLADLNLVSKAPVKLPDAILPQTHRIVQREAEGTS